MTNKRDALFVSRMADLITEREKTLHGNKSIQLRSKSRKIDNKAVLEFIFFVARTGIAWSDLEKVQTKVHYQTIYKRFQKWTQHGIFHDAWLELLDRYKSSRLSKNALHFTNLYIDTTDVKTIEPTVERIPFSLRTDNRRTLKLAGDKAYRSKAITQSLFLKKRIRIVSEPRSTERNAQRIGAKDKKMFKRRIFIEHLFGMVKRLKRLRMRVDCKISHYRSFWLLAISRMTFHKLLDEESRNCEVV